MNAWIPKVNRQPTRKLELQKDVIQVQVPKWYETRQVAGISKGPVTLLPEGHSSFNCITIENGTTIKYKTTRHVAGISKGPVTMLPEGHTSVNLYYNRRR